MLDFGGLVYLDVQKTGSTFVTAFLRAACRLPERRFSQHRPVRYDYDPSAVHVISVRDPLAQYLSLYRYGLDGRGGLHHRLVQLGCGEIYRPTQDGFEEFVQILLDPEYSGALHDDFVAPAKTLGIGFMTFRHLLLALRWPLATLADTPPDALLGRYRKRRIWTDVLWQETLSDDLRKLVARYPDLFDPEKAEDFLVRNDKINIAETAGGLQATLGPDTMMKLCRREHLLYRKFYPHKYQRLVAQFSPQP
ncbi:hypothetical protein [Paracoccus shandongensis]|uniref:hypothetical protein n=1 Tax=Paracoccus shandongensis TaxID=2816048 RepID=UPI001A8DE077|nr:hypothetical protein [Paracoccus shandongensis]